ncbi:MAG: hypothetical protein IJ867_00935 [Clostridia bacterium]|nr:hypothetical protein [Clostridia bacterium]
MREISDVYKEALTVLSNCDSDVIAKIPDKVFKALNKLAADSNLEFYIDSEKSLAEQDISEECKDLLSIIYYTYMSDKEEKKEILSTWGKNEKGV